MFAKYFLEGGLLKNSQKWSPSSDFSALAEVEKPSFPPLYKWGNQTQKEIKYVQLCQVSQWQTTKQNWPLIF